MRGLLRKTAKAIRNPNEAIYYIRWRLRRFLVRRVVINGEIHFRYKGQSYPESLLLGNRMRDILPKAQEFCRGKGIDVGAGRWVFPNAIPIENEAYQNAYQLEAFPDGSLDFVFSSHCLEHLDRWQEALRLWIRKLKQGGILFLYLPHETMALWRRGSPLVSSAHKWVPTWQVLNLFLEQCGMEILEYNSSRDGAWSFHIAARKNGPIPKTRPQSLASRCRV